MPASRAGVAGTKQKKRLQRRNKKGCCRSCVIWAKDGEHRPREEPRPAAQTLATQPELARAAVVSHTSQSVLPGPKVGSWLVRAGRLARANTARLALPVVRVLFSCFDRFR
jgi:hypothetical protein